VLFKGAASGSKGVAATATGMIDDIPPLSPVSGNGDIEQSRLLRL